MMSPRLAKVLRDLASNKVRTLLVIVSIAVGVMAVGATLSIQTVLSRELEGNWQSSIPASGRVNTGTPFTQQFVNAVRQMPEIEDAVGRANTFTRVQLDPNDPGNFKYIDLNAIPDFNDLRMNVFVRADGPAWPPPVRTIVLSTVSLGLLGVEVGDTIEIRGWDNKITRLKIVGTAWTPEEASGQFAFGAAGWVSEETWQVLGQPRGFTTLAFRVKERKTDSAHITAVARQIEERAKREGWAPSINVPARPGEHPAAQIVTSIVALMTLLGTVSLALSGFLVINTVSAVLAQHVRQIGVMKTIGARTGQLGGMYAGMVLLYGALSLLVALPLGLLGSRLFVRFLGEGLLNLRIADFTPPMSVFALQFGIALIAPLIAAIAPILSGARKTVREALSDYGIDGAAKTSTRDNVFSRFVPISRPVMISLRNTFRRKGRLVMTLATLTLGGAIFIGVISARQGLVRTLDAALGYWGWDFSVNFANPYPQETVARVAAGVPGVRAVETWGFGSATILNEDRKDGVGFSLTAPPADSAMLKPIMVRGRWINDSDVDAIVLNTEVLERSPESDLDSGAAAASLPPAPKIDLGDTIEIKINGNIKTKVRVVGIAQGVLTGPVGYMNRDAFLKIAQYGTKASFISVLTNTTDPVRHTQIAREMEEAFKRENIRVGGTEQMAQQRVGIMSQFDIIIYMLLAMAILLAVVGGLGLAGTMSINVIERTREIGVMRAIGANNGAIRRIVVTEGLLIGLISWMVAAVLAYPFSIAITTLLSSTLKFEVLSAFSVVGLFGWLGAVMLVATVASILPAWNASRLTVREVLAYA
jgi:putative ABC transport system permease protein